MSVPESAVSKLGSEEGTETALVGPGAHCGQAVTLCTVSELKKPVGLWWRELELSRNKDLITFS